MKTHELAHQLELTAKLLKALPDSEIDTTLELLFSLLKAQKPESFKSPSRQLSSLPDEIEQRLGKMTPAEIEGYLNSSAEPFSTGRLLELADRLGITSSRRQSRNALVNLIARYYEAGQMDAIIRSARKEEG